MKLVNTFYLKKGCLFIIYYTNVFDRAKLFYFMDLLFPYAKCIHLMPHLSDSATFINLFHNTKFASNIFKGVGCGHLRPKHLRFLDLMNGHSVIMK